jgi:hypothetical protein
MVEQGLTTVDEVVLKVPNDSMGMMASGRREETPKAARQKAGREGRNA